MKKSVLILLLSLLGAYLLVYSYAIIAGVELIPYILSPLGAFFAGSVTLYVFIKPLKPRAVPAIWLLLSISFFTWAAADIIWAALELGMGIDPSDNMLLLHLYTVPNVLILASSVLFVTYQIKRWNRAKLLLDAVMFTIMVLLAVWILLLDRDITFIDIIVQDGPLSAASILADVLTFMALSIWLMSVKRGKIALHIRVVITGFMAFVLTDLYYYHISIHGWYSANSVIDVLYIGSMLIAAVGGLIRLYSRTIIIAPTENVFGSNASQIVKYAVLLAGPLAAMAATHFEIYELLVYIALVAAYAALSLYFRTAIKREALLAEELRINSELEQIIECRTRDLRDVNEALRLKNEELIAKNKELAVISNRDMLTNLYNRWYLLNWLEEKITRDAAGGEPITLMYIDIDRFKLINDTYGHEMGDKVLVELAKRLSVMNCDGSILVRMGGDEFVHAYTGECDGNHAVRLATQIIDYCGHNIYIDGYEFSLALSIGISKFPHDATDVGGLLKNADIALHYAKERGVKRAAMFSEMIRQKTQRRNTIEFLLRGEDITREMMLYYQPQFRVSDNRLIGAEALIRWKNAEFGMISPGEFIPIAEQTDSINRIGIWVLQQAASQAADWNNRYQNGLVVGINVSPKQLNSTGLVNELSSLSSRSDFNPAWLDIEVTESAALEDEYRLMQIFSLFKSAGMSTSIDDFGTGYSSIASLKNFPFDRIKIAKPLVDSVTLGKKDEQIVKSIILLADSIGMTTIAEGVETQAQYNKLKELGCGQIQGYLLGRPVPAEEFEALYLNPPEAAGTAY